MENIFFEIVKKGWFKQKYSFRIVSSNGKILCSSEKYNNRQDVQDTIDAIKIGAKTSHIKFTGHETK